MALITRPNLAGPDDLYARLIAAHEGLPMDQSAALNARLVLILVNHIGDEAVLDEALRLAEQACSEERQDGAKDSGKAPGLGGGA